VEPEELKKAAAELLEQREEVIEVLPILQRSVISAFSWNIFVAIVVFALVTIAAVILIFIWLEAR
tara:strand:+ start:1629 stop:1823 length:195 start_codon:yes stop_codon:yes gene_type:complete